MRAAGAHGGWSVGSTRREGRLGTSGSIAGAPTRGHIGRESSLRALVNAAMG